MSLSGRAVVGRKTPGDGKLEVSADIARALGGDGTHVQVHFASGVVPGAVSALMCTCEKAGRTGQHEHHFVQCEAFRDLPVGSELQLNADPEQLDIVVT